MSDIDDIFSVIHKPKTLKEAPGLDALKDCGMPVASTVSKKALKKARKAQNIALTAATKVAEKPEKTEISSIPVAAVEVTVHINESLKKNNISKRMLDDDQDGFFDSRGSNGKRKKTDDGFDIYHEDELKIGLGGDTEDCPFDCACCY